MSPPCAVIVITIAHIQILLIQTKVLLKMCDFFLQ